MFETGRRVPLSGDNFYKELSLERKVQQEAKLLPEWFSTSGYQLFKEKYLWAGSYREQIQIISKTLAKHTAKPAKWENDFFDSIWNGWHSPSTPILSNCGTERGLVVSCSGQYVNDSIEGFYDARREAAILSKHGFGCSAYLGDIRARGSRISTGGKALGLGPILKGFVQDSRDVSQGGVRRGSFAGYIPMDHGDFWEVIHQLEKDPDDLNVGWNVTDAFIAQMEAGDAQSILRFQRALKVKMVTGKGYFWFVDKANRALPQRYKDDGLRNYASNLCSEILLPSNSEMTYTCVLSSLNLSRYDEWKDTPLVATSVEFLNAVCSEFIEKARGKAGLENAVRFTEKYRAIGVGVMGFHTYLQKNMIPMESFEAHMVNHEIFKKIRTEAEIASNGRNASLLAVAPTKSTALIMGGESEGINPDPAYVFTQATAGGEVDRVNPVLLDIMKKKGVATKKHIKEIGDAFGSVQDVDWLDEEEKKVFRTAFEMNQTALIRLASARAQYIDQWQSVNLFFSAGEDPAIIASVHKEAFLDENIRGLYYIYSKAGVGGAQGEACEACAS
jgi:ribonucleoside-diphosphate reductase alpha chain